MSIPIVLIWAIIMGMVVSFPMEIIYKAAVLFLPMVFVSFVLNPFFTLMAFLIVRPELELFSESGLLKYFSVIPMIFLFMFMGMKKFDFCWKRMKYFYIFIFVSVMSVAYSVNPAESVISILRLVSIACVYLITFNLIETSDGAIRILSCFPIAIILPLLIGFKQFLLGQTYVAPAIEVERVEGLFTLANSFARFLFVTLFASVPLLCYGKFKKIPLYILMFLTAGAIVLLEVRSVFLGLIAAFGLLFMLIPRTRKYITVAIPVVAVLVVPMALDMFQNMIHPIPEKIYGGETFFWRLDLWRQLFFNAFLKKPIFGFGVGTSLYAATKYTTFPNYPHNDYLRILIENGILGFIFYLAFFIYNLIFSYTQIRNEKERFFNACAFILIFSFLFMSAAANIFYGVTYFWYFFSYLAIVHKFNVVSSRESVL